MEQWWALWQTPSATYPTSSIFLHPTSAMYRMSQHQLYPQCPNICYVPSILTLVTYPKLISPQTPSSLTTDFPPTNDGDKWSLERKDALPQAHGMDCGCLTLL